MRRFLSSFVLASALVSAAAPVSLAEAQGDRRVVVQRFRGARGASVRRRLIENLEDNGVTVVPEAEVRRARRQLGFGRSIEGEQYVALARELDVVAFIDGRVTRRRRRWSLRVRVRNALDGAELGGARWGGRSAMALAAIGRNGFARLSEELSVARGPGAARQVESSGEVPWWERNRAEGLDVGPDPDLDDEPDERDDGPPPDVSTRYDAMRIMVLGGTLYRSMETMVSVYASQRGVSAASPESEFLDEVRRYQSGGIGHFELGGRLELYPGSFDEEQSFPYLGIVLELTHSIGVQSNGFDRLTAAPVTVPTDQLEVYAGLRLRYRFGPARREPEFHLDAGWGTFNFNLGLDQLQQIELDTIIPPMQHGYVQAAIGIEYGVVPTYLTLGLEVGGRIGTNIGGDTRNVWGTTTAPSNGVLVGAHLRVEIPDLVQGAFFAINVRYFLFSTDFQGQVGCAVAAECAGFMPPWADDRLWEVWPVEPPGGGMADLDAVVGGPSSPVSDNYVRLQLAIGYAFY